MRRSWGLLLAAVVVVARLLAVPNGSASAATPRGTVTSTNDGVAVSWHTPATRNGDASVMNHVLADDTALNSSMVASAPQSTAAAFSGASSVVTLRDSRAPHVYQFPLTLPAGARARLEDDGSVTILDAHGAPLGSFQTPWATDATGQRVSTHYSVSWSPRTGYVLVQHVDPNGDATYPITADPHYTWGIATGTVYFNKNETAKLAAGTGYLTTLAALAPSPFNYALVLVLGTATVKAQVAQADNECIKIKSYGEVDQYTGGYCR